MKKLKQLCKIGETIAKEFEGARIAFAETHSIFYDYYLGIFYECYTDTHGWVRYLRRPLTWRLAVQLALKDIPLVIKQSKQHKETQQSAATAAKEFKNSGVASANSLDRPSVIPFASPELLAVMRMPNLITKKTTPAKAPRFRRR